MAKKLTREIFSASDQDFRNIVWECQQEGLFVDYDVDGVFQMLPRKSDRWKTEHGIKAMIFDAWMELEQGEGL